MTYEVNFRLCCYVYFTQKFAILLQTVFPSSHCKSQFPSTVFPSVLKSSYVLETKVLL
jgi:hypothetical protein